jgi:hypothetical protein
MNAYIRRILTHCVKAATTVRRPTRSPRRTVLRLDHLEDRTTPNTYTVNSTGDTGTGVGLTGDFRYCLTQANTNPGPDAIQFSLPAGVQTISLTSALPTITGGDLTVTNTTGASNLIIQPTAGSAFGVFAIGPASLSVIFDGITIAGGNGVLSGAITNAAATSLIVRNSVITGNTGIISGGIYIPSGSTGLLTIQNSTISGNVGLTGGIYFFSGGNLLVQNSTISGNVGTGTQVYEAGGIVFFGTAGGQGITIENSTISGNSSASAAGGGGINFSYLYGSATIRNCTITQNSCSSGATGGGGVGMSGGLGNPTLSLLNTIVAQNTGPATGPDLQSPAGVVNATNSLVGVAPPANFSGTGNLTGTSGTPLNPMLGTLQNNGGLTFTRAPLAGSPVIDAGDDSSAGSLTADQRGFLRNFGAHVDIGAVEDQPLASVLSIIFAGSNPTNGTTVSWTVTFSNPVTGLTPSNFALVPTGVTGAGGIAVSGSGTTWTVTANTGTGDGTLGLNMVNPTGVAPIIINTPFSGSVFTIDKTPPTVSSIVRVNPNPTNLASVQYTVTFSEAVTGVDPTDFKLTTSGVAGASVTGVTGSGNTRTVTVNTGTANPGTIRLDVVDNDSIIDLANNKLGGTGLGNGNFNTGQVYNVDNVAPTVTINQAVGQADPTNVASINFTVVFSEPVSGFGPTGVTLGGTVLGTLVTTVTPVTSTTYTVNVTGMTPGTQGTLTATVNPGAAADPFTNGNVASTSTDNTVTFDNVKPNVTINQAVTQSDPTGGLPINFTVVFNEPVTGFSAAGVSLSGSANPFGVTVTPITSTTYTVSIANVTGAGDVIATVNADAAMDAAGNTSNASTSSDNDVTFIIAPPTVTINQGATQADPTNATSIIFDVAFNQPVSGFDGSDVLLTGSLPNIGSLTATVAPSIGFNSTYTVTITGMTPGTQGTITANIPTGAATGQFANSSVASTSTDNTVTFDNVKPDVTVNQQVGQADPTNGSTIVFDVVFSEPVVGFGPSKVTLGGTLPGVTSLNKMVSGSGAVYTVTVSGMPVGGLGTVIASVVAGAVPDLAGNTNTASTSMDNSVTFDNDAPQVTINQGATQVDPTNGSSITFDVLFSEPVTGFTSSDVVLGGTLPGLGGLMKVISGTGPAYTVTVTGMPAGGFGTITATIPAGAVIDAATNPNKASTSTDNAVLFDNVAPTVTINQAPGQPDPTNTSINFTVVFSEPVTGFDPTDILLSGSLPGVGGLTRTISGSGPTYTVTVSGLPTGMQGTVMADIAASGVTDLATNPNSASTSTDNSVLYDNIRPTVTIDQAGGQVDPTRFPTIQFTVVFSEPVTGFDASDVVLSGTLPGVAGLPRSISGSGTTYTVTVSGLPAGGLGTVVADVADGAAQDTATNSSVASTSTDNSVLYDNEAPTVTINQGATQADPTNAGSITFDVVFSEPVFGFTESDVTLSGSLPGVSGLTKMVSGSGSAYTVTVTGMPAGTQGTVVANIASGVATDLAGNNSLAPTSTDNSVLFDNIAPTVSITRAATQADPTNVSPILFTVAFSEPVNGFDASDIDLSGSTIGGSLLATVNGSGTTYTVSVTGMAPGSGTVVATVIAGAAFDAAGNPSAPPSTVNNSVTYDTVSPTVTIDRASGTGPTNSSPVFAVVFSEPVTGFTASDISFAGSTVSGVLVATVTGSGSTYTVTVTGMTGVGNVVASIPAVGAAVDLTGNPSQPSTSTNNVVPFDGVAPTVTINSAAGQPDPASGSPINFTVVFSEPVTGFTGGDVNLSGSTVGGILAATVSGSGTTYTVSVTGMTTPGNVVATIPAGAAADLAGNTSGVSTSTDNVVAFDNVAPTVTVNQAAGQADPATTGPINFTVVFSKPVVGFGPASVDFSGSTVGGILSASVTGSGTTYTVSVTGMDGTGLVILSVPAGVVTDALGNTNAASTSSDHTVRFDNQPPLVTIDQAAGQQDPTSSGVILFTVTFSEPVFGFSSSDISFAGSTAGGALIGAITGSGTTFTVSVTGMSTPGTVVVTIAAGAVTDAAGNPSLASTSTDNTVTFDNVAPTVTVNQAASQADPANAGPILFTVTFGAPVTGFDASDVSLAGSTAGGNLAVSVSGSGATYTVAVNGMASPGNVVVSIPAGAATDAAGNPSLTSTSTDNTVTFNGGPGGDTTPPSATIIKATGQADPASAAPINFTITFSETVTGFDASDVSFAGSTAGGSLAATISGSGPAYTIGVTGMTSPGDVVVSVPAGAVTDLVGNPSLAVGSATVAFATGQQGGGTGTFAVGSGEGAPSQVNVYNSTGQTLYTTAPFDSAFTGGNRVAVADVTGDGVADYVIGTGPGVATLVQVINGATRMPILTYQPFEATFTGGVFVAVGDVTGDKTADIIITPDKGGGPRVLILQGGTANFPLIANFFGINDPSFRGGARAAAGDINADGFADVAVAAGFQGGPRVSTYDGKALAQGRLVNLFGDLFIFDGPDAVTLRNGVFIAVGDVNGDGFADLIGGGGPGGGPRVLALSGFDLLHGPATSAGVVANFFAGSDTNRGGVPLAVKDLDGDRFADLVTGSGPGAGTRVTTFKGSTLASGTPTELSSFDAFGGLNTGVFVG